MSLGTLPVWLSKLAMQALDSLSDDELSRRFAVQHDERAFRALVVRHGPMVLGVCRRILGDRDEAEDAFQATFLVLARRIHQLRQGQLIPWLHGVARRTAMKARVALLRRRRRERMASLNRLWIFQPNEPTSDLREVLDEEIANLPQELRTVVILCDLQGYSRRQASAHLRCPESTLSSRLSVARARLAKRLRARGVTLSIAGLVAAVSRTQAEDCASVVFAALRGAEESVPVAVLTLSSEVVTSMYTGKRLALFAGLLLVVVTGGTLLTASAVGQPPSAEPLDRAVGTQASEFDRFRLTAFDGFDGRLGLDWKVIRPDASHVSLRDHPGYLTIRTQRGSLHGENGKAGGSARNLVVIDNPFARGGDFTATTCLANFRPADQYQQAGLLLYSDDDNYVKWTYEFNDGFLKEFVESPEEPAQGPREVIDLTAGKDQPYFVLVAERDGEPTHHIAAEARPNLSRVWLRVTKRGNVYDFFTSQDGKRFVRHGSAEWDRGGPQKIGFIAQNGRDSNAMDIEAAFDFFELRAP